VLRVRNLQISYGQVAALRGIDLDVGPGELVALVGANGAGKSTLLKAISGLVRPTGGSIEFLGERIDALPPSDIVGRGLVHVPEGRRIFPKLSVEQNLSIGAYPDHAWGKQRIIRDEVYALFPRLKERRRQAGASLSGGEQQLVAFGRAMMARPQFLMLDEPSLGLAPIMVDEVAKAIDHFRRGGVTVLLVEQNAELALTLASRGYVIETGRIVLSDTGENLLENPQVWASYLGQDPDAGHDEPPPVPAASPSHLPSTERI
jgi:branched-chain amino acid transport system ATP-binding protein